MKSFLLTSIGLMAASAMVTGASAQDRRTVVEPTIPPTCATLDARLTAIVSGPYKTLAEADEGKLDTARIQAALDSCGAGKAVELRASNTANAFVTGPLELRQGVTLLVSKGATLFASIDPRQFENAEGSCGIVNTSPGPGCKPLISVKNVSGAGIMGEGVIDGRGGIKLIGRDASAWEIGQRSSPGAKRLSRLVIADKADDFTMYLITLRNSPNFNVSYDGGNGFTAWGVKIDTPKRVEKTSNPLSRNTDGIDPGNGSTNITITRSFIRTGDDNIAIKGGTGGATHMTISQNHFYWGHGMSIGSQTHGGVSNILVTDLTLDGSSSGLRIKSAGDRGGLVQNITYENVCIRGSEAPIDISASYSANNAAKGDSEPSFRNIVLRNVATSGGGEIIVEGYDKQHRAEVMLDGVYLTDSSVSSTPYTYKLAHADVRIGPNGSNISLTPNDDSTMVGKVTPPTKVSSCAERFVPFPAER